MIITGCGRLLHLLPTAVFLFKYPFQPELVTTLIIGKGNNPSVKGELYHLSVFNGKYPVTCSSQTNKVGAAAKFPAYIKGKAPYICPFGTCDPHCSKRKRYILNMYIIYFHIPGRSFHLHHLTRKPVKSHAIYFYRRDHRRR